MTNSDENKELLRDEEVTNKGAKSEDYAALLSKIRKQVDIEGESTLTRKYHEESNTDSVEINEESEKPQENDYEETVVLDRNELKQALIKQEVKDEILPEKKEDKKKPVLEVLGLKKRIGLKTIVEDISFDMHEGEIIGLLGPNGSGKTTIMRMLVGLTKTTKGEVYCFEKPLGLGKVKMLKEVGAMIETPEFYNYMSGWSNLKQMARVCGKKVSRARMKELVEFVGLSQVIRKKVKTYSLGMRQRLGLAQALLNDPKILILDEPVNGLDPQGVQDFRNKLKEIAATGVSILISSHLLDEIEKVSDRVIVIEKGRIIADDKLDNLVADETIKTLISTYDVEKAFENISREDKARVITYLVTNNVELDSIRELTTSLEDRFLQITGGENK